MATFQLNTPKGINPKDGNTAQSWKRFKQNFNLYLEATEKQGKTDKLKIATLLNLMGEECVKIFNNFNVTSEERENLGTVMTQFDNYFEPRRNTLMSRYKFFNCKQAPTESVHGFLTNLKTLAKDCDFNDPQETLIRDFLIIGLRDKSTKESLLMEPDLTLEQAIKLCQAKEITEQQIRMMQSNTLSKMAETDEVDQIKQRDKSKYNKTTQPKGNKYPCRKCKTTHDNGKCPAYGVQCYRCKKLNHFANACRAYQRVNVIEPIDINEPEEQICESYLNTIEDQINSIGSLWKEDLKINGKIVTFKLDSGSDANIIPERIYEYIKMDKTILRESNRHLKAYTGHAIELLGETTLQCELNFMKGPKAFDVEFCIVKDPQIALLGADACLNIGLIQRLNTTKIHNINETIYSEYADVFSGKLGKLQNTYDIKLQNEVEPRIIPARLIPAALKDQVKTEIDRMVDTGILKPVTEPTEWVHPLVIVQKPNKKIRICMDPRHLNKYIKRQHYCMPTQQSIFSQMEGAKYFSVLDASSAFLQIPLTENSSLLCTVATPFGRYRYCRLPYGLASSPEVFQSAIDSIFVGLQGVVTYVDDILVFGKTQKEHDERLKSALDRARQNNLTLSKDKCKISAHTVEYLGYTLSAEGISINDKKIQAVTNYNIPRDKKELQRYLGMINYLAKFIPNLSNKTAILRNLLSNKNEFVWTANENNCFQELKTLVTRSPVLVYFDTKKKTVLSVDASSYGMGAVITQDGHPVAYASSSLTECQQRYSQIEKELLAVVSGIQKFHYYLYGTNFIVETDHRPLLGLIKKPIDTLSPRLQRLVMSLLHYSFQLLHVPGKQMYAADALSRAPQQINIDTSYLEGDACKIYTVVTATPQRTKELQSDTLKDTELSELLKVQKEGWPEHKMKTPEVIRPYWNIRLEIHTQDDLLFYGNRLIIPKCQRKAVLNRIHEAHQGINSCQANAKIRVYWPGMMGDIYNMVSACDVCQRYQRSNTKQPLIPLEIPELPWEEVGIDFAHVNNRDYLVMVDYHSKFMEIHPLSSKTAIPVIGVLKRVIRTHGIPRVIHSDNGPPFDSHMYRKFANDYEIKLQTSSPGYPRANGMVERTIQTIKGLLYKTACSGTDPNLAILEHNNTPKENLPPPATMLMGRTLRTKTTVHKNILQPIFSTKTTLEIMKTNQQRQKKLADRGTKELQDLKPQQKVMLQRGTRDWIPGEIVRLHDTPRSYVVKTDKGELRRNRIHLRPQVLPHNNNETKNIPANGEYTENQDQGPNDTQTKDTSANEELLESQTQELRKSQRTIKPPARYRDC